MPKIRHVGISTNRGFRCLKCGHAELNSTSLELLQAFYQQHFGFELVSNEKETWQSGITKMELQVQKLKLSNGDTLLELVDGEWAEFHICIEVDEFPTNIRLIEPERTDKAHKDKEVKFCMDPLGNMIEMVRRKK